MKIKNADYKVIETAMHEYLYKHPEMTLQSYLSSGKSEMRYRWDVYWFANIPNQFRTELCNYLNDNTIDTALRAVIKQWKTDATEKPTKLDLIGEDNIENAFAVIDRSIELVKGW